MRDRHGTSDEVDDCLLNKFSSVSSPSSSNPSFDQYIGINMMCPRGRCVYDNTDTFVVHGTPATLPMFEQVLFGPFMVILQQDIDRTCTFVFHPILTHLYMFQVLAQMLLLYTTSIPAEYRSLLPFLLTPVCWQQKGSIPGLVKLLRSG
ncbi:CAS/CSE protein [Boletus edulis]|nr:CAS/CSE protein [Boletus edulis]